MTLDRTCLSAGKTLRRTGTPQHRTLRPRTEARQRRQAMAAAPASGWTLKIWARAVRGRVNGGEEAARGGGGRPLVAPFVQNNVNRRRGRAGGSAGRVTGARAAPEKGRPT